VDEDRARDRRRRGRGAVAALYPRLHPVRGEHLERWLLPANSCTFTDAIGDGWITDLAQLANLAPLAGETLCDAFLKANREAKELLAERQVAPAWAPAE
jgi:hypothetical protein